MADACDDKNFCSVEQDSLGEKGTCYTNEGLGEGSMPNFFIVTYVCSATGLVH